jgi:hypothetical protein
MEGSSTIAASPATKGPFICPSSGTPSQLIPEKVASRPEMLTWHPSDSGDLVMAAWSDRSLPSVWCAIRNSGKRDVRYCNYALGYYASVRVLARQKGSNKWLELPRRERQRYVLSAGPSRANYQTLGSGQEMPPIRDSWLGRLSGEKFTLHVDLEDFQWPKQWSNEVELYITQTLGRADVEETWSGTLQSEPVAIDLERVRRHAR